MRKLCILIALGSMSIMPVRAGKPDCRIRDIRGFALALANAHKDGTLADLDLKYCAGRAIQISVEHSISIELNSSPGEKTQCHEFRQLATWLKERQTDGLPAAGTWPLESCGHGICSFGGNCANQAHNTVFLKEIHYQMRDRRFQITKIIFEDGD